MGIIRTDKKIDTDAISCGGELKITLSLTACPDIASNPADIVLLLDNSGSMEDEPLENLKISAKNFIDMITEATGGDARIKGGSQIGIVSFAASARVAVPLTDDTEELKTAVDALRANGQTNHYEAFTKGMQLFDFQSDRQKIMLMFTDGLTTTGRNPDPVAEDAKEKGITIYCIGLGDSGQLDIDALNRWASEPVSEHVATTQEPGELNTLFARVADSISKAGATEIVIDETVDDDFEITEITPPEKGTAEMVSPAAVKWNIPALGVRTEETAVLEFSVHHVGGASGIKAVNASINYRDAEEHEVTFPDPKVEINCLVPVIPEECPAPMPITAEGCQDFIKFDAGEIHLESLGRIIELDVTIKNVCPGKRTALAVILTEEDCENAEQPRGLKTFTIPAHDAPGCRDVLIKCIRFVVPEDIALTGMPDSLCSPRRFKVRFIAHPIDFAYRCCEDVKPQEDGEDPVYHGYGCKCCMCRCGQTE